MRGYATLGRRLSKLILAPNDSLYCHLGKRYVGMRSVLNRFSPERTAATLMI